MPPSPHPGSPASAGSLSTVPALSSSDAAAEPRHDRWLKAARRAPHPTGAIASLPDGAFVSLGDNDFRLVWGGGLHRWTPQGYVDPVAVTDVGGTEAAVATPSLSVEALRHGYPVTVHPSVTGD
jgi:hypothetical protein